MKSERLQSAIFYAELRNFTRLSEVLDPTKVLALANDFFNHVARAVAAQGGKVLSVQNDSIAAAFTAGEKAAFAGAALKAAQAVQGEFGALGERWKTEYGLPAAVSLGLHLGEETLGAEELPPLELGKRPPIAIYGLLLETRLDFT
jgi:adenylate cyclase